MKTNNGDLPAMPMQITDTLVMAMENGAMKAVERISGFTKREQFAMAAMQGLLSGQNGDADLYESAPDWVRNVSEASIEFADALLAELEKAK